MKVKPGSLIVNDIFAPNPVYPADSQGNINTNAAALGVILDDAAFNTLFGMNTKDYDYDVGVFYPADANSADLRCRNEEDQGRYDCRIVGGDYPGGRGFIAHSDSAWTQSDDAEGSGGFEIGNPFKDGAFSGGGTGCHANTNANGDGFINQLNAKGTFAGQANVNIAENRDCQCNTVFVGYPDCKPWVHSGTPSDGTAAAGAEYNCWDRWIDHWVQYGTGDTGGFPTNINLRDVAGCWMTNMRDMINLQNWFWLKRFDYSTTTDAHEYWGWNEIPVTSAITDDSNNHETLAIVVPQGQGSLNDISHFEKDALVGQMDWYYNAGYLVPGLDNIKNRPGSYIVMIKQIADGNGNYGQYFFCQNVDLGKYKVVFNQMVDGADPGSCYVDWS